MSRGQQGQVFNQTQGQSNQAFGQAENAYSTEQADIGDYQAQLGKYATENPYGVGGQFQSAQNEVIANTADASAQGAGARLQELSARTGQNPAGAIGATEAMEQSGERAQAGQEAEANTERIGDSANYNKGVLAGYGAVPGMENEIATGQGNLYGHSLGAEEQSAQTPSFLETLEGQLASAGNSFASAYGKAKGEGN